MALPKYSMHLDLCLMLLYVHALEVFAANSDGARHQSQDWLNHGGDLFNRRYAYKERKISTKTAPDLRMKWKFYAGRDITATPAIYDGTLYFPSWNGNIYAVKEADGSLVWKQNLEKLTGLKASDGLVENVNWTVSRSTPTVAGDLLMIGVYSPAAVVAVKRTTDNHSNSILALDLDSGKIRWYRQFGGYDVSVLVCSGSSRPSPNCPPQADKPDVDFGEAPMMLTVYINRIKKDIVVAVQKSGIAWALDRNNGHLVWYTEAGPYGLAGGGSWGAATDEKRVYTNIVNSDANNFTLAPSNEITTAGGWVAMDAHNGRVLWSTANPSNSTAYGPVSVANDVVFAGSADRMGYIYAIDAKSGKILWSYKTGASVYGGMSISRGCIYVGHGYNVAYGHTLNLTDGTFLFAFCV
ncbi:hypothetical protein VNO80_07936 [Phaseolus coccineus]|uniref:Pyrrolo-quinoline quinone repeat domain-containing protein n=1 Tax=Phaseolus coccineus TaxID=3886 RepID=A0AAN9NK62_PHACN